MFEEKFNCSSYYIPDEPGNYRSTLRVNNDAIERLKWNPSNKLHEYIKEL